MMNLTFIIGLVFIYGCVTMVLSEASKPHILFIVADDLGWNDVSWNNPDIKMPTLDKLARKGVILNSSYVQPRCSPSRGAFMTGYYPFHLGLQHGIVSKYRPKHLPTDKETLPEALKKQGYATHMVGKWHLGFCNWNHTPTYRGFDSFYGFYSGTQDYYDHTLRGGYDFRFNTSVHHPPKNKYSTSLFGRRGAEIVKNHDGSKQPLFLYMSFQGVHSPLQVPKRYSRKYAHIQNTKRKIYSGMVSAMDEAVQKVMIAMKKHKLLDNLLVVFTSDNGGDANIAGSNWPLRGSKNTLWEGGTRVPTFVYSKTLIRKNHRVSNALVHASDWFPTFVHLAGGKTSPFLDGIDQWLTLSQAWPSKRTEFVYNINEIEKNGAIRMGNYKLIIGKVGRHNNWYPAKTKPACNAKRKRYGYVDEERQLEWDESKNKTDGNRHGWWFSSSLGYVRDVAKNTVQSTGASKAWGSFSKWYDRYKCEKLKLARKKEEKRIKPERIQLFDLKADPIEKYNIAGKKPILVKKMIRKLNQYKKIIVPAQNYPPTKISYPKYYDGIWSPGWC